MAGKRPTMRELDDARSSKRREEMRAAIAEGRLKVRQMTPAERKAADARHAAAEARAAGRSKRRS